MQLFLQHKPYRVLTLSILLGIFGTTLFDLGGLQVTLGALLGVPVDVLTPGDLPPKFRASVLAEARPV